MTTERLLATSLPRVRPSETGLGAAVTAIGGDDRAAQVAPRAGRVGVPIVQ